MPAIGHSFLFLHVSVLKEEHQLSCSAHYLPCAQHSIIDPLSVTAISPTDYVEIPALYKNPINQKHLEYVLACRKRGSRNGVSSKKKPTGI